MIRRFVFAVVFTMLPGAAMAQHHEHAKQEAGVKQQAQVAHSNFARELIAARAELKLTDDQIRKLEALAVKMDEMHKKMDHAEHHAAKADAKTEDKSEMKMHADLLAIFTEEQLVKVKPMMKAHHDKAGHTKHDKKHVPNQ